MSDHAKKVTHYDIQRLELSIEAAREECQRDIARLAYEYAPKYHDHDSKYARLYHRHEENAGQYHSHPIDVAWWWLAYCAALLIWVVVIVAAVASKR